MKHELRSDSLEWDWPNPSCTSVCCGISETIVAGIKGTVTLRLLVDMQTHVLVGRLRKNDAGLPEIQWSGCLGQQENTAQDAQNSSTIVRDRLADILTLIIWINSIGMVFIWFTI